MISQLVQKIQKTGAILVSLITMLATIPSHIIERV